MNIRLLGDRVLIKPEPAKATTESGLILTSTTPPERGTVVAVGPGVHLQNGEFVPTSVKVGDVVIYGKKVGEKVLIEDEEFLGMNEPHIMGVLTKKE